MRETSMWLKSTSRLLVTGLFLLVGPNTCMAAAKAKAKRRTPTMAAPATCPAPVACPVPEPVKRNRFMLLGGYGPDGLSIDVKPKATTVTPNYGALFGAGYQRLITDEFSVGAFALGGSSAQSRTFVGALALGWDW